MEIGQTFTQDFIVEESHSAVSLGSGGLNVFGTPAMIAFMECTALKMIQNDLPEGFDTVGICINAKHLKASPIGAKITITARITLIDGRKIGYEIEAKDHSDNLIGTAYHERFIVDKERFMSKL